MPNETVSLNTTITALEAIKDYADFGIGDLEHDGEDASEDHAVVAACDLITTYINRERDSMMVVLGNNVRHTIKD